LRDHLAEPAERVDVRVLLWAGAPLPVFSLLRSQMRRVRDELTRGTKVRWAKVRWALDSRERPMHCHHEKLVIVDGKIAFVGGIDLTSLGGDRFDSGGHPARNVVSCDPALARGTRMRLWSEHLERPADAVGGDSTQVVDELWEPIALEQLERRERDEPATHRLLELRGSLDARRHCSVPFRVSWSTGRWRSDGFDGTRRSGAPSHRARRDADPPPEKTKAPRMRGFRYSSEAPRGASVTTQIVWTLTAFGPLSPGSES
jgi:hypothetical protein